MARNEKDRNTKLVKSAPVNGADTAARDPFAILDEIGEAFKDVPPEEIEREVAKAVQEVREGMRAERQGTRKSPKPAHRAV
jgi:hypothetical protein